MCLVEGDLDGVEARLLDAERALEAMPPAERATSSGDDALRTLPAWIAIYRASAAQARGDAAGTAEHARRALELAGPEDHFARGGAAGFLGLAAWADGDLEVAVDTFTQAVASLGAAGNLADELGSTVVLADMWQARGHPGEGPAAVRAGAGHRGEAPRCAALDHRRPPRRARRRPARTRRARRRRAPPPGQQDARRGGIAAGEPTPVAPRPGRPPAGPRRPRRCGRQSCDGPSPLYLPGFFPDVRPIPAAIARIRIAQGRLDDAWDWAHEHHVTATDDLTYLAEFNHLTLARLLIAQYRVDGDPAGLADALGLLDRVLGSAQDGGRGGSVVDAHLLGPSPTTPAATTTRRSRSSTAPWPTPSRPATSGCSSTKAHRWRRCSVRPNSARGPVSSPKRCSAPLHSGPGVGPAPSRHPGPGRAQRA